MNSKLVLLFIYELFYQEIKIWLQNNNIKIFIPKGTTLTRDQQNFLKLNRDKIYYFLKSNQIYTKQNNLVILKSKSIECELSFAQERLWFIDKYENGTNAYNIPIVYRLHNDIKLDILEKCFLNIVNRHETLRTVIKENKEGYGYQVVLDEPLKILKVTVADQEQLDHALFKEVNHIYDLSLEYPIRVCLYKLDNGLLKNMDQYYLSIVIHHIAFDGWSHVIFFRELQMYYDYYLNQFKSLNDSLSSLPSLNIQYKDFAIWQRYHLSGIRLSKQLNYWKNKLNNYETLNLITDKPRPNLIDYRGQDIRFEIEESISVALRELAKELNVSLFSLLLSAYYLMLRSYTNQDDIIIGTPAANRHYSQIENMIGFFVNSLALRTKIDPKMSIKKYIKEVGSEIGEVQLHQELPFEKLVEELGVTKDTSRHPLFQIMFIVQGFGGAQYNLTNKQKETDLSYLLQPYVSKNSLYSIARFDITTLIDDSQVKLSGCFNYAVSLYAESTIKSYIETYKLILNQLGRLSIEQLEEPISNLKYISANEYERVIVEWNRTEREYPDEKTMHQLFEEQVNQSFDSVAVIYEDHKITYGQLNERSNQLASYIREVREVKPDTLVVLCLDRSEYMLISILGVLKAGAAYVPIDPSYPDDRIRYILEDTGSKVVITNEIYKERLKGLVGSKVKKIAIDSQEVQAELAKQSALDISNSVTRVSAHNLAYVIYTSGTTGNPKGVMINHRGVVNRIKWMQSVYQLNKVDKVLHKTPYVFDVSVWEILWANWYGATIVFAQPRTHQDANYLIRLINKHEVTVIHFVPSMLSIFGEEVKAICSANYVNIEQNSLLTSLRYVFCSGEELQLVQVEEFRKLLNQTEIHNLYGPTESSIDVFYYKCTNEVVKSVYLGSPIFNTTGYVLDSNLSVLPIGAVGELYIGGVGLARGYLNRADLTAEKFIANPFQTEEERNDKRYGLHGRNARLYKTGDLVRWLPDGNLEYIGRSDFQVKIRGYRIELGEIESLLNQFPGIKQSVVIAREHVDNEGSFTGNKYLVGYYVAEEVEEHDNEKVLDYLSTQLPEYMVPTVLVQLDKLPLTINGKLDRSSLPIPEFGSKGSDSYVAPRNELENSICEIFSEVLKLDKDKIGIKDDFFRLGGNSILAIRLASKINHYYHAHLKVSDIFVYKNIELLLPRLLQTRDSYQTIVKLNNSYKKPNIFMIHPGIGGCEVYISLADKLKEYFSCYGVDSYNLYQDSKIDNLYGLAKYYLRYIDQIMEETCQTTYHILGWSLGGQIALEIASILEQKDKKEIIIYLLDSVLYSNDLLSELDNDVKDTKEVYKKAAIAQGYDKLYIEKTLLNIEIEKKLVKHNISSKLINTYAILFKAMLGNQKYKMDEYNNIRETFKNKSNIKLFRVNNAHHGNILEKEEVLIAEIVSYSQLAIQRMDKNS
ncbi:MAG: amino acid adenylation domain-containing protein [Rickettsiales bacterium]|nr:amino acid adenylation domain-containing protein [Rickettsiales bacterium]